MDRRYGCGACVGYHKIQEGNASINGFGTFLTNTWMRWAGLKKLPRQLSTMIKTTIKQDWAVSDLVKRDILVNAAKGI